MYHVMEIQTTRDKEFLRALLRLTDRIELDANAFLVDGCLTIFTTTTEDSVQVVPHLREKNVAQTT